MRYLSVCSGIEAATVAWHRFGWEPVAFSEIEAFPSAVLAHHYPNVPNWGDMTKFEEWPDADVDVLVGGTPCQSFSVAGLRKGLDDPRGNLMLTFLAIARRYRPHTIVWENVPGVLSSNGGRDFGTFLRGLGELGYGWAYRVLDAQYVRTSRFPNAVPQRRRRVFVVGCLGDWRRAAAVLFEPEGLQGHPPPRRAAGKVAPTIPSRSSAGGGLGTDFDCDGGLIAQDVAPTLNAHFGDKMGLENQHINGGCGHFVAHALRGEGFDASEDGTGRGTPIVPVAIQERAVSENPDAGPDGKGFRTDGAAYTLEVAFSSKDYGGDAMEGVSPTLRAGGHDGSHANAGVPPAVAFAHQAGGKQTTLGYSDDGSVQTLGAHQTPAVARDLNQITSATNRSKPDPAVHHTLPAIAMPPHLATPYAVRRLVPEECEALQGFPRGYTRIPYRKKTADACPDGPRYKALGNSIAINCLEFIAERIAAVEEMKIEMMEVAD
jgi:DNA (cytosine-5)-methyltransferase 1